MKKTGKHDDGCGADGLSKRDRILDAAFVTFLTHGYSGASTLEIATRAKVSKRELYSLFKDKADLFAAGIKGRTDIMRIPLASPDLSNGEAFARTLVAFGSSLLTGITHPHVLSVHRLAIAEGARAPELAEILDREGRQANANALAELMREAQKRGFVDDAPAKLLSGEFAALLTGDMLARLLVRAMEPPSPQEVRNRARRATDAFLKLHGK